MVGKEITIVSWETQQELSLNELCDVCHVSHEFIQELVEHGAIHPQGVSIEVWRFNPAHIRTVKTVIRLQHDLEVNLPGAALALDLLEQMEQLRNELALLQKHIQIR